MGELTVLEPKAPQIASQTRRKRLTEQDILAIAELNAKRVNDAQACELLDINYETWRSWKTRAKNQPRFARILARIKGIKIKNCMESIEKAGERDWRATREYLSLIDPEQFNDRANSAPQTVNQEIHVHLNQMLAKVYAEPAKGQQQGVIDVQETKQLPPTDQPSQS